MKHSRNPDFYKTYKKVRKQLPPEGQIINPKNEYDRRDRSWTQMDEEDEDESVFIDNAPDAEHFNLDEFNKKLNEKPVVKKK